MRYVVTGQSELFNSEEYVLISVEQSLEFLEPLKIVGLDTETRGFDPYTKELLSVQLGNTEFQILIDCTSIDILEYKKYLEDPERLFILVNAKFDLKFFYHKGIIIPRVYDIYLAEKIRWLGYPPGLHGLGLKDCAKNYLGVDLDKSVRGNIIWEGLTERVIIYACDDVKYLEPIREKQLKALEEQDLLMSLKIENEFVKWLAYIEYCGVALDVPRWKKKMERDQKELETTLNTLNAWVIEYCQEGNKVNDNLTPKTIMIKISGRSEEEIQEDLSNLPKNAIRNTSKDVHSDKAGNYIAFTLKSTGNYIYHDMQGDLFLGFSGPKCSINWNSAKQVIPLFEELGFNLNVFDKETGKMKKSIDASVIEPQKHISSIAPIYLKYKAASKVVSTYGQNFLDAINKVSGRIHTNFNQLMDTGRLSCGGKDKENKTSYLNLQNLPADEETRACFIAEPGNLWASADYKGQESVIIANVSKDPALIELFLHGCGDVHSLTAKMAYSNIIGDTPVEEVKEKFHGLRQDAKGIEFAINYGGDANTIMNNKGIPLKEAQEIYDNYMKGFPGVKYYQDYCRKSVMEKGYILLNPIVRNKAYIYDFDKLNTAKKKFTPEFWEEYNIYKRAKAKVNSLSPLERNFLWDAFVTPQKVYNDNGEEVYEDWDVDKIAEVYNTTPYTVMSAVVKKFFQRKSASEKQSINYRIQGTGALCFKLATIKFCNYLRNNNLLFKVKYCIPVHDELNIEFPEELKDTIPDVLVQCMREAGDIFCKIVKLDADVAVSNHWIH